MSLVAFLLWETSSFRPPTPSEAVTGLENRPVDPLNDTNAVALLLVTNQCPCPIAQHQNPGIFQTNSRQKAPS